MFSKNSQFFYSNSYPFPYSCHSIFDGGGHGAMFLYNLTFSIMFKFFNANKLVQEFEVTSPNHGSLHIPKRQLNVIYHSVN